MFKQDHYEKDAEVLTGTTIMAIKVADGIIIGADSRTSLGSYIPSRLTDKLTQLSDKIYCCVSGSSADTQIITRIVKNTIRKYESLESLGPTVKKTATLAKTIIYNNPQLLAGLIIAGFDEISGGTIYNVNIDGALVKTDWTISGSGSGFIYGYCDMNWRENMSAEEGLSFVRNAIGCAIKYDNHSGGCIRMALINNQGTCRYFVPGDLISL